MAALPLARHVPPVLSNPRTRYPRVLVGAGGLGVEAPGPPNPWRDAPVVETVDTVAFKATAPKHVGSNPTRGTAPSRSLLV
jgi:hypothetical protein